MASYRSLYILLFAVLQPASVRKRHIDGIPDVAGTDALPRDANVGINRTNIEGAPCVARNSAGVNGLPACQVASVPRGDFWGRCCKPSALLLGMVRITGEMKTPCSCSSANGITATLQM